MKSWACPLQPLNKQHEEILSQIACRSNVLLLWGFIHVHLSIGVSGFKLRKWASQKQWVLCKPHVTLKATIVWLSTGHSSVTRLWTCRRAHLACRPRRVLLHRSLWVYEEFLWRSQSVVLARPWHRWCPHRLATLNKGVRLFLLNIYMIIYYFYGSLFLQFPLRHAWNPLQILLPLHLQGNPLMGLVTLSIGPFPLPASLTPNTWSCSSSTQPSWMAL